MMIRSQLTNFTVGRSLSVEKKYVYNTSYASRFMLSYSVNAKFFSYTQDLN